MFQVFKKDCVLFYVFIADVEHVFIALIFLERTRRTETYSEPCQTSKIELFAKIASDICHGSKNVCDVIRQGSLRNHSFSTYRKFSKKTTFRSQ